MPVIIVSEEMVYGSLSRPHVISRRVETAIQYVHSAMTRRSRQYLWNTRVLFAIGVMFSSACTSAEKPPVDRRPSRAIASGTGDFIRLDSVDAPDVPMRRVGAISLGTMPVTTPGSIDHAVVTSREIVLVDNVSRALRGYGKSGSQRFTLPTRSDAIGSLRTPMGLATAVGDSILVVDLDEARGLSTVSPAGTIARQLPLHLGGALIGVAQLSNGKFAFARITTPADIANGVAYVVAIVNSAGKPLATGCIPDSVTRGSVIRHGMFSFFRDAGVSTLNGRIYCRQAVSPAVQVLSADGAPITVFNKAPPFYRRGVDQPASMSMVDMNRFRSTWWEHSAFYPVSNGFVSIYASFDLRTDDAVYRLFACDSTTVGTTCHTSIIPGKPVAFVAPDTLYVSEPIRKANDLQQLSIYIVSSH